MCEEFSEELSQFVPDGKVLVVGLGNNDITPDALGPQTASKILATRHLKEELKDEDDFLTSLRPVGVLASGVLGQTGIETAELLYVPQGLVPRHLSLIHISEPTRP